MDVDHHVIDRFTHGTNGLILVYALSAAGVLAGFIRGGVRGLHILRFPITTIPVLVVSFILVLIVKEFLPQKPWYLKEAVGYVLLLFFGFIGGLLMVKPSEEGHQRGTVLDEQPQRLRRKLRNADGLTLAGQPLDYADETKHFKLIGTTGTGKSTAIRELLAGALRRGDRAVIADPDGSYLSRFYDPHRGDVILNPFDPRAARWDLFREMQTATDADQLSRSLIADTEGTERNWRNYARVLLTSLLRQLHRVKHNDVAELYQLLSVTPIDDLRELLNDTPAGPYLAQDNGKFFGAVRAVANTHLAALEHIATQNSKTTLSVRRWIKRRTPGVLFLPYQANEIATLRSLISTWMRIAIFDTMSQPQGEIQDQRLWFVIDELDALGQIDSLKDALARLRKFGGRCVLGFQSIAQVSGTYGHAEAQTIVENCGNTLILRCSASENGGTARFASRLIGEREVTRESVSESRGAGLFSRAQATKSTSIQHVTESAVLPSQIEQLPDLEGYLKFASTPEWRRVRLRQPS